MNNKFKTMNKSYLCFFFLQKRDFQQRFLKFIAKRCPAEHDLQLTFVMNASNV